MVHPGLHHTFPLDGNKIHSLPLVPDVSVPDGTVVGTEATVTISECLNDHLKACIVTASPSVWGIQDIFPAQLVAVYRLLHPTCLNQLAVIQRTGAGKTHILWMLGVIKQWIVLIFITLRTLSADVMLKLTCADLRFGAVIIQHLNKLYNANKKAHKDLLQHCQGLLWSTTMTVFIFLSPQFLINHPNAHGVFIECLHCTTLPFVALDEAHIHLQHGTLFCNKIHVLQAIFFSKIFGNNLGMKQPRIIAITATIPDDYLQAYRPHQLSNS